MAHADAQTRAGPIWLNARLATLAAERAGARRRRARRARRARRPHRLRRRRGRSARRAGATARESIDCDGRWITPGLIDCHTHLVYAGDRAREFELRLAGASYEEIARAGGGIVATVARDARRERGRTRRASRCRGSTR